MTDIHFFAAAARRRSHSIDVLDGRVRAGQQTGDGASRFARPFITLAWPRPLAFDAGMRGGWDAIALGYFVCCG